VCWQVRLFSICHYIVLSSEFPGPA
jgi:hypothetical protein